MTKETPTRAEQEEGGHKSAKDERAELLTTGNKRYDAPRVTKMGGHTEGGKNYVANENPDPRIPYGPS